MEKIFKIGLSDTDKTNMANQITAETLSTLIPAYSTSIEYSIGQYVVYNGALYRCIGTTTGAWDSTKWESATLEDLVDAVNNAVADVAHKANIDGYYSTMGVGHADSALSLDSNVGNNDETPFNYQTAGGDSDITTGIQSLKKLVGASVVFNQLVLNGNAIATPSWSVQNGSLSVVDNISTFTATAQNGQIFPAYALTFITGHKYLSMIQIKTTASANSITLFGGGNYPIGKNKNIVSSNWQTLYALFGENYYQYWLLRDTRGSDWDAIQVKNAMTIDLTQMFGSQVADYIYAKEQANAGDGVAIFKSMFPNDYYAYNTGTFIHSQSAKLKMVDYNQWDEETELGGINTSDGATNNNVGYIRSKNFNNCLPNTVYYVNASTHSDMGIFFYDSNYNYIRMIYKANATFTTPANARYYKICWYATTYNHDICISLYWDGSRIGYEPYQEHIYNLPNDELKGILKVVNNKIVADGDEEYPDGTKKVRYGSYTFTGNESYVYYSDAMRVIVTTSSTTLGKTATTNGISNTDLSFVANNYQTNGIYISTVNDRLTIFVCKIGTITDVDTAKAYLVGKTIQYELATPTETTSTAFAENIYVDDFGTMEFLDENNARISGIQGNEIFYKANISGFAESLYVETDGDVDALAYKDDIDDTALATRGYIKLTSITGYDATKTQVLKNIEGVFTWVDEV